MGLFRKAGGGGFLNGVDGRITGYQFTDEFNGVAFDPKKISSKTGKPVFHALNFVLSTRVDGADADQTTTMFAGGFDDYEISADGLTITPNREGGQLAGNTDVGVFIESLVAAAAAANLDLESRLTPYNFEGMIGTRVRFAQQANAKKTADFGKVKDKKTGKPTYDRKDLIIETVYELAPVGKAAGKPAAAKGAKVAAVDAKDLAIVTQLEILEANGPLSKSKIGTRVIIALNNNPLQGEVRKLIGSDEFQAQQLGWTVDAKTGLIALAA